MKWLNCIQYPNKTKCFIQLIPRLDNTPIDEHWLAQFRFRDSAYLLFAKYSLHFSPKEFFLINFAKKRTKLYETFFTKRESLQPIPLMLGVYIRQSLI